MVHHYVPVLQNLWMPGLSARLEGRDGSRSWRAPVDGSYGVYAADFLAEHAWFDHPLEIGTLTDARRSLLEVRLPPKPQVHVEAGSLEIRVNGRELGSVVEFRAARGEEVTVRWQNLQNPVGLFILPRPYRRLFMTPGGHASLDVMGKRFE